jgi:pimeloyl-ACP methyl ester carboxylesterase
LELHATIKGHGNPIVFLHGFGSSSYSFHYLTDALSKKYQTIAIDLKGFGDSPKPDDRRYSVYDQAVLVEHFIQQHHLKNVTLVGHSYGGGVALSLALLRPKLIKKIVLIDSVAYRQYIPSMMRDTQIPIVGALGFHLLPASYEMRESYDYLFYDKRKIDKKTLAVMAKNLQKTNAKTVFLSAVKDLVPEDIDEVSKRYKNIKIPTLIIWGDKDVVVRKSTGYRLHRDLKNSKLKVIEKCGHIPHEEKPKEVLKYILDFL